MARPVLTKKDFVRRYAAGEFGNASPTWETYNAWAWKDNFRKYGELFHIRNRIPGGDTKYNVPEWYMKTAWVCAKRVYGIGNLYISAMAPTDRTLIQGEVERAPWGLSLYYTTVRKPMRDALREEAFQVNGLRAALMLQAHMDQRSQDWLEYLFEKYPDHVVEFSTYGIEWGTVPGFNTVFWEVRKY